MKFDPEKNAQNIAKHGLDFHRIVDLDWSNAVTVLDVRVEYKETRNISYVMLEGRLHILVWTPRNGEVRPISFRKANKRERNDYEAYQNT